MYKASTLRKADPQGMHVIDRSGSRVWVVPPFFAYSWEVINDAKPCTPFVIWEVAYTKDGQLVFMIGNKGYPCDMFYLSQEYP